MDLQRVQDAFRAAALQLQRNLTLRPAGAAWEPEDATPASDPQEPVEVDVPCWGLTPSTEPAARASLYVSLALVVIGLTGNTLNLLVFWRMRKHSSAVYICALAASDLTYLLSVLLSRLLATLRCLHFPSAKHVDVYHTSDLACKLLQYLMDGASDYSSLLILSFTVERLLAVAAPFRVRQLCSSGRTRAVCCALLPAVLAPIAAHHLLMVGVLRGVCTVLPSWERAFSVAYLTETVVYRVVPVFTIAIANIIIIHKVRQESPAPAVPDASGRSSEHSRQLTVMLLLISAVYVLLYLPVGVHYALWAAHRAGWAPNLSKQGMLVAQHATDALYIAGFSCNFFLYSAASSLFRERLRALVCPPPKGQNPKRQSPNVLPATEVCTPTQV